MIDASRIAVMMQSAMLLAGIWVILFWFVPAVRLDCFRQRMFALRDELFDYAAAGKIAFGHPAYRLLRQQMNGFIRYGHQVSFFQFLMTWLAWKVMEGGDSFKWNEKWQAALDSLDAGTKNDLLSFHARAVMHVGNRIVLGSPVLLLSLVISLVLVMCHMGLKSMNELLKVALSETAARAVDQRILDEEAARAAA